MLNFLRGGCNDYGGERDDSWLKHWSD